MKSFCYFFATLFAMVALPCDASEITNLQAVKGKCEKASHIAEGAIGEDLTKRHSRFFCDSAVISSFDEDSRHIMVLFSESKSVNNMHIGFAGFMEEDGQIMNVSRVYLGKKKIEVTEGHCKFFFKNRHMHSVSCGAPVDENGRRTVPIVSFTANPGQ